MSEPIPVHTLVNSHRASRSGDGAIRFIKGAAPANPCVMATRVLDLAYDWIEFTYNRDRGRWAESGFFSAA